MDQREIVKKLGEHFREEEKGQFDHRKKIHESRESLSDSEWWDELMDRTRSIRPQMLPIFERNKEEMISKRLQTISCEEGFREKMLQKRVMALLPHVSAVRSAIGEPGILTEDQIRLAKYRQAAEDLNACRSKAEKDTKDSLLLDVSDGDVESDFIQTLIDTQLKRQEELN